MNKFLETLKAILASNEFRKNAVELVIVSVAAVTGAIISNRIGTSNQTVETIDIEEVL